ncbi:MAG: DUF2336 domain-containing protein [Pseudomonadota bacterium]
MAQAAAKQDQAFPLRSDRLEPSFDNVGGADEALDGLTSEGAKRTESIVRAATDAFVAPRRRSPQEITVYAQLIRPLLPKVSRDTLRWVAAVLSGCEFAPSETCRTLANQSISIAAPVLATASKLSVNDQIAIAQSKSEEHRVLLAQRSNLSALVIEEIIAKGETAPVRHLLKNKPKAMTEAQGRTALGIIASAMSEEVEAKEAAQKLASPSLANDPNPADTNGKAQDLAKASFTARAEQMAQVRLDLHNRTSALEKARNDLLALAQRARGHDVRTPSERSTLSAQASLNTATRSVGHASQPVSSSINGTQGAQAVAEDMVEVPAPPMTTPLPKRSSGALDPTQVMGPASTDTELFKAAESLDRNGLQRALEKTLELSPVKVSKMMAEPGLETLCVGLRAVECQPEVAYKLLTATHMMARRDMRVVERLRIAYSNLNPADCRKALDEWQRQDPLLHRSPNPQSLGLRGRVEATGLNDELFEPEALQTL